MNAMTHASRSARAARLAIVLALLGTAAALALWALRDNLVFFHTPSELRALGTAPMRELRMGGIVEPGSVQREPGSLTVRFVVADERHRVLVVYRGLLPDLFAERRGVVASGRMGPDGQFQARQLLARHDETYQPPDDGAARPAWVVQR